MASEVLKLPRYRGKAYRAKTGLKEDISAADVVRHEQEALGNKLGVSDALLQELENYSFNEIMWVGSKPEDVERYGTPSEVTLSSDARIVAEDDEGGYLVLTKARPMSGYKSIHGTLRRIAMGLKVNF